MGTQVLRPQDCLIDQIRSPPASFSRRRSSGNYCSTNYYYNNHVNASRSSRKAVTRSDQRKRVPVSSVQPVVAEAAPILKRSSSDDTKTARSSGLAMEKVTILRRGKSLDSATVPEKTDMYAGSACAVSPSPSAVPLPFFLTKKQASAAFDDSATRDLRRLLRLE